VIIFCAELEITHYHCDLGTSDDENDENDEEETKEVVELMQPDGRHDKEEFDEDCSKRKDSSHEDREDRIHVPHLIRNLSWNLVGAHWNFHFRSFETQVTSNEYKRNRHSEPQDRQSQ